MSSDRNRIAH